MPRPIADHRCFSYGGQLADLVGVTAWMFDAQVKGRGQVSAYVKCAARDEAFRIFFANFPEAKIFGTGLPLIGEAELGRHMSADEVVLIDDSTFVLKPVPST